MSASRQRRGNGVARTSHDKVATRSAAVPAKRAATEYGKRKKLLKRMNCDGCVVVWMYGCGVV